MSTTLDTPISPMLTRRNLLGAAATAGAGLVLMPALRSMAAGGAADADVQTEIARGVVYDEADGKSKGIEGIRVSNGRDIVKTDAVGRYQIDVRDGDVLFIIKPSGWMTPLSEYNLPKYYYFHRPKGSPQWRPTGMELADKLDPSWCYKGSPATGPLPPSIDFALSRREEPDEFKVVVFGDTQISHDGQIDWMSRGTISELVNAPGVAFGLSVGDLVNVGLLHLFPPLNEIQAKTGFPWYTLPGNHDQNLLTPDDTLAEEEYRAHYGPTVYGFDYGPASFLMMGNVRRTPMQKLIMADKSDLSRPETSDYHMGLQDGQWQFVEAYINSIPKDRMLVMCMHMELGDKWPDHKAMTERLMKLISGRPHTLSISGHTHIQQQFFFGKDIGFDGPGQHHHYNTVCIRGAGYRGMFDELRIPTCQAEDGVPAGYSYITFTKDSYKIRFKCSRHDPDYQMNVFVPATIKPADIAKTKVLANVFAGSERSKVKMRLNGGEWLPMEFRPQADPSISWVLDSQKKPQSWLGSKYNPADTPAIALHIWQADLPTNLKAGAHTLEVESTDMYGQVDHKMTLFRVVDKA